MKPYFSLFVSLSILLGSQGAHAFLTSMSTTPSLALGVATLAASISSAQAQSWDTDIYDLYARDAEAEADAEAYVNENEYKDVDYHHLDHYTDHHLDTYAALNHIDHFSHYPSSDLQAREEEEAALYSNLLARSASPKKKQQQPAPHVVGPVVNPSHISKQNNPPASQLQQPPSPANLGRKSSKLGQKAKHNSRDLYSYLLARSADADASASTSTSSRKHQRQTQKQKSKSPSAQVKPLTNSGLGPRSLHPPVAASLQKPPPKNKPNPSKAGGTLHSREVKLPTLKSGKGPGSGKAGPKMKGKSLGKNKGSEKMKGKGPGKGSPKMKGKGTGKGKGNSDMWAKDKAKSKKLGEDMFDMYGPLPPMSDKEVT